MINKKIKEYDTYTQKSEYLGTKMFFFKKLVKNSEFIKSFVILRSKK